jgi:hypothetical protein
MDTSKHEEGKRMSDQPITENPILLRTSPGAVVPSALPPDALFILNLGPYFTDETQELEGVNESRRAKQLMLLAENLEEISSLLEDVRNEQIVGTDPDPNDEDMVDEVWVYLNGIIKKIFSEISNKVESLQSRVNELH